MSKGMSRQTLLESFGELKGQFDTSLAEAKELDDQFMALQKKFHQGISGHLLNAQEKIPKESPIRVQLEGFLAAVKRTDAAWQKNINCRDKGLQFRKGFNDSLLVFVYGKVKSGKSSLGNYMAWGQTDPDIHVKTATPADRQPSFFSHENTHSENGDSQNEALNRQEFRVGATEATSSIQGFRLPGLTWVDSPGLHSVNEQNGRLAKDYVEHADLILYTMRSDAPGRASDLNEIQELKTNGKEMLILVTGSDINQEDWDEVLDEIKVTVQMKPQETRRKQRDYIAEQLGFINSDQLVSISARYAQEHANDLDKVVDSGMGQLFSTLHRISQQDGVRLKRNVPMRNFYQFIKICGDELAPYHQFITDLEATMVRVQTDVTKSMTNEIRAAQAKMRSKIEISFEEFVGLRNDEHRMNEAIRNAHRNWNELLQQVIGHALHEIFSKASERFKSAVSQTWHTSALSLPDFSVDKVTEMIPSGVRKGNRGLFGGAGTLVGAGLGFLIGGPVGATVGSVLGGAAGGAAGHSAEVSTRSIEVITGDNFEQIREQTRTVYSEAIEKTIRAQADTSLTQLLADLQQTIRQLSQEIMDTQQGLDALKLAAEQKIR